MPRRNLRSRRTRGRRQPHRQSSSHALLDEYIPFSIAVGTTAQLRLGMISLPLNRNFRPVSLQVTTAAGYVPDPANGSDVPGGSVPCALQLEFYKPTDVAAPCCNTAPVVLGPQPRRITLRYPRNEDWYSYSQNTSSAVFGLISAICLGSVSNSPDQVAYIRGFARVLFRLGPELLSGSCPAPNLLTTSPVSNKGADELLEEGDSPFASLST